MFSWLWSYLGPLFPHAAFWNGEVYTVNLEVYDVLLWFEHDYSYMIGLISEEPLNFGLLAFSRLQYSVGTFEVGAHVFYMFKYDPYTLMCLNNHIVERQWNVVI